MLERTHPPLLVNYGTVQLYERYLWALSTMDIYTEYELNLYDRVVRMHYLLLQYLYLLPFGNDEDFAFVQQALGSEANLRAELNFLIFADCLADHVPLA